MRISDWSSDVCSSDLFTPETSAAMVTWGQAMMMSTSLLAAAQLAQANFTTDFRRAVRQIPVPTRIIHGDRDASAPLALPARAPAALLPPATLGVSAVAPPGLTPPQVERLLAQLPR